MSDVLSPMPVSSGDLVVDRRFEWARESLAAGDAAGAADLLEQTVQRAPRYAPAWFALGQARDALDDTAGAIAAFREARGCDADDRLGAGLHLVRLGAMPGSAVPAAYVQTLYDAYAPRFEQSLVDRLGYRAPDLLLRAVRAQQSAPRFHSMLDLGCGTGLAGVAFHPICGRVTGVDLSPAMLAKAQAKGVYARLATADVLSFLADEATANARYDLIVAADVLIYIDALAPLLAAMARVLTPGGLVAFDVETHDGTGSILRETLRYAHSADIVHAAAADAGLRLLSLDSAVSRHEKGVPVPGLVAVAEK